MDDFLEFILKTGLINVIYNNQTLIENNDIMSFEPIEINQINSNSKGNIMDYE